MKAILEMAGEMSNQTVSLSNLRALVSGKRILEDITFEVPHGTNLGVFGESGSGKSTLARYLANQLSSDVYANVDGFSLSKKVSLVHQNPLLSLNPVLSIKTQLDEALSAGGYKPWEKSALANFLEAIGIKSALSRLDDYPLNFSGGELQRIAIIRAILYGPDILILDEATSALDEQNQEQAFSMIRGFTNKETCTVIVISHSISLIRNHTDYALYLDQGRIIEQGTTSQLLQSPRTDKLKSLMAAREAFDLTPKPIQSEVEALSFSEGSVLNPDNHSGTPLVAVKDFKLFEGESLGIVAPSGTGKSSLLKGLLGTYPARFHDFRFAGLAQRNRGLARKTKKAFGYVLQDPRDSFDPKRTISKSLEFAARGTLSKAEIHLEIENALLDVGLDKALGDRLPAELSGGQLQRASIARAILTKPKILFLDEPTSALDQENEVKILELLQSLRKKYGLAILLISHSSFVTKSATDRTISI